MPKRATSTSFKKGRSGNPGGRPKEVAEVRDLARVHTVAAVETLAAMLGSESDRTKVAAAEALLDRGWGKSPQTMAGEGGEGELVIKVVRYAAPGGDASK